MVNNTLFKAPHDGVISIDVTCTPGANIFAKQTEGCLYIELNKVVYFRDYSENSGLVHLLGGIDIVLDKPTFAAFVDVKRSQKRHWGYD